MQPRHRTAFVPAAAISARSSLIPKFDALSSDRNLSHSCFTPGLVCPSLPTATLPVQARLQPPTSAVPPPDPAAPTPLDPSRRTKRRSRPQTQQSLSPSTTHVPSRTRRQVRVTFERARQEERNGNVPQARTLLRECLRLDRRDAHSWLALARLEARTGGAKNRLTPLRDQSEVELLRRPLSQGAATARALFKEGVAECPDNVHLLHAWAVLEHRCGNRESARALFRRAAELQPNNPYVCHAWGLMEQRLGNKDVARDLFRRTIEIRPHPEVCGAWAVLEARDGNVEQARKLFEQGLAHCKQPKAPSVATICRSWAEMEERIGDLPRARELLAKAIASQPHETEPYIALGNLEARRGCTTRALELMSTAAGLSPRPPASVFNAWAQIEWQSCNRVEDARKLLERGHALHPTDPAILQSLGTLEEKCGNIDTARKFFDKSISVRPTAPAFVAWALLEEREGDVEDAKRLFEEALQADAMHGAAYNAYGMMEARRGKLDNARAVYERGLKAHASASVWHGYGQLELKLGRNPERARELFRQGVGQTREETAFIWHSWGMLELSEKRVRDARQVFSDAMRRYPRNSRLLVGAALAAAASCQKTFADERRARNFFTRAVAADPTHAHAWQAWGVFELRRGRPDAAQALFRRGLRLCPSHGALWQGWGVLETARGNFGKARKLFKRGTESCPAHVHLFQAWACMEVRAGNIDKARLLLDHALESDCRHGPVWNAYGLLEARHGVLAKARQVFATGIRRAPDHAPLYRTFGQTEARAGNYEHARELFRQGLKVDPRHAPLYHALAQFEALVGNVDALADLKHQAESFFGSEVDAARAMHSGEEIHLSQEVPIAEDSMDDRYGANATPMEKALDGESLLYDLESASGQA